MAEATQKELQYYVTPDGKIPFNEWFESLKDKRARQEVSRRLGRALLGNFGDHRSLGADLYELKISYGPAYRIYYTQRDNKIIVLLCAGNKSSQTDDIRKAKLYLQDYLGDQ